MTLGKQLYLYWNLGIINATIQAVSELLNRYLQMVSGAPPGRHSGQMGNLHLYFFSDEIMKPPNVHIAWSAIREVSGL